MSLSTELLEKKVEIAEQWLDQSLRVFVTSGFFKTRKDRIGNPIGFIFTEGLKEILAVLSEDADLAAVHNPLEKILKVNAVQDFKPSQAVSFVFKIKGIVRELIEKSDSGAAAIIELPGFDGKVDQVALMAFDIYMQCRERLHQIRIRELETGTHTLTSGVCRPGVSRNNLKVSAETYCST